MAAFKNIDDALAKLDARSKDYAQKFRRAMTKEGVDVNRARAYAGSSIAARICFEKLEEMVQSGQKKISFTIPGEEELDTTLRITDDGSIEIEH